jgi:hypothetical protein
MGSTKLVCPFHQALSINYQYNINHAQLYAQAYHLYKEGFKYWEAGEEIKKRKEINKEFRESNLTEELFFKYYKKPTQADIERQSICLKYLSATDIKIKLCQTWGINSNDVSNNTLGKILTEYNFQKKIIKGKRLFVSLSKKGDYFINSSIFNLKTYSYFD